MADTSTPIYLGTVLLERNRWTYPKEPSFAVSEWLERIAEAGFDGIELWQYHATLCSPEELAKLEASPLPIAIFNSYAACDEAGSADRQRHAELAARLRCGGMKFNVGNDPNLRDLYLANARAWLAMLPREARLLCECHPGTLLETPDAAANAFDAWNTERIRAIIHPFNLTPDVVRAWFARLGPAIVHAHVQYIGASKLRERLDQHPDRVREILHIMREEGFAGSFTVEFTAGTSTPDETMELLFANAVADLHFLREHLA